MIGRLVVKESFHNSRGCVVAAKPGVMCQPDRFVLAQLVSIGDLKGISGDQVIVLLYV